MLCRHKPIFKIIYTYIYFFCTGGEFSSNMNTVDKSQIRSTKSTTKGGSGSGSGLGGVGGGDWPEGNSPCKSLVINHPFTRPKQETIHHLSFLSFRFNLNSIPHPFYKNNKVLCCYLVLFNKKHNIAEQRQYKQLSIMGKS